MIKTMSEFYEKLNDSSVLGKDPEFILSLIKVIELRLQRVEKFLGITIPEDLWFFDGRQDYRKK